MNNLLLLGSLIGNIEEALLKYRKFKKENSRKWASYWLGVIDTNITIYKHLFANNPSRIVENAIIEIDYKGA